MLFRSDAKAQDSAVGAVRKTLTCLRLRPFVALRGENEPHMVVSVQSQRVSDWQSSPQPCPGSGHEVLPLSQGGRAADIVGLAINEMRSRLKWLWTLAWTETNFCKLFICRNRSIARSLRRNARCEFLAAQGIGPRPAALEKARHADLWILEVVDDPRNGRVLAIPFSIEPGEVDHRFQFGSSGS